MAVSSPPSQQTWTPTPPKSHESCSLVPPGAMAQNCPMLQIHLLGGQDTKGIRALAICLSTVAMTVTPVTHALHGQQPLMVAALPRLPSSRGRTFGLLSPNPPLLYLPTGWQATVQLEKAQTGTRSFLGVQNVLPTSRMEVWQHRATAGKASSRPEGIGTRRGLGHAGGVTGSPSSPIAPCRSQQGMSQGPFWVRVFPLLNSSPPPFVIPVSHDCINTMSPKRDS